MTKAILFNSINSQKVALKVEVYVILSIASKSIWITLIDVFLQAHLALKYIDYVKITGELLRCYRKDKIDLTESILKQLHFSISE